MTTTNTFEQRLAVSTGWIGAVLILAGPVWLGWASLGVSALIWAAILYHTGKPSRSR